MADPITILITAGGAPQSPTLIRHLRNNGEREVRIVAVDMDGEASGRFLADTFYQIPPAGAPDYEQELFDILRRENPDCFLNVSGTDVPFIARLKPEIEALGIAVCVSDPEPLDTANNKFSLYRTVRDISDDLVPEFESADTLESFVKTASAMGYPDRELCFKPHVSKGSRGFRILSEKFDRRDQLLNQKPVSRYMTLDEFVAIFQDSGPFPQLLLMEVVVGEECDVMTIGYQGQALLTTVKSRESHRWGVIDKGELIERPDLVEKTERIIAGIPLSYNISLQFIDGRLIEINPRTSTFIYSDDFNEPWIAVKLAMGLMDADGVKAFRSRIPIGRRMVRHMDQIFYGQDGEWST